MMEPVAAETQQPPAFLAELNADSNLSYVSNQSAADAADAAAADSNSQDGCSSSTPAQPLARKRPYRKQKGELDFLGITSNLPPSAAGTDSAEAASSDKFAAESLFEYQWPQEKGSEQWMLQEHVQEFLGISSFKRKHPEIMKRNVEMLERDFLRDNGVVTELQCDLGLTALKASEVMDLMAVDYVDKYEEYVKVLQEKEKEQMKNRRLEYKIPQIDKNDMVKFVKKAMNSCAEFNSMFLKERREERCAYFDMQTLNLHYPKSKYKVLPAEMTKPGLYPVALIPGQYQNYYKKFSPEELKYLPISSVTHHPPKDLPSKWQDPSLIEKYSDDEEEPDVVSDDAKSESESDSEEEETKLSGRKTLKRKFDEVVKRDPPSKDPCHKCKKRALGFGPLPEGQRHSKKVAGMKELISCTVCKKRAHPWCWDMTIIMAKVVKEYDWQCMECKTCVTCSDSHDEEKMMFCDLCDRGYHSYCVGLHDIPLGKWECPRCNESKIEANPPSDNNDDDDDNDDDESPALTARPLTGRGSRGTRRARGARSTRGEARGRATPRGTLGTPRGVGGTPRGTAGTPRGTAGTPRGTAGTPRGTPRGTSRGISRGTPRGSPRVARGGTPRGRGTRAARGGAGAGTPRTRGRGRGRGRASSTSSSPSRVETTSDIADVQAAIDAVAAGFSDDDDDDDSGSGVTSRGDSDGADDDDAATGLNAGAPPATTKPVPLSLVKVAAEGAKGIAMSLVKAGPGAPKRVPIAGFDDDDDDEDDDNDDSGRSEEAQEESRS